MKKNTFDIAVLGAGPAGASCALFFAQAGLTVALIEKRSFAKAGPSWVNGIYLNAFEATGLLRPNGEEIDLGDFGSVFFSSDMKSRIDLAPSAFTNVRMRPFMDRIHRDAFAAGVTGFEGVELNKIIFEGERPVELQFVQKASDKNGNKERISIRAKLFVDATGVQAVLRKRIPALQEYHGENAAEDSCSAFQENCHIADLKGAQLFLQKNHVAPGAMVNILGTSGGYSTMTVHISPDLKEVGLLAGASKAPEGMTAPQMLKRFKSEHAWIGKRIFGGGGIIPLRTPLEMLTSSGVAIIGNAANQVFSTHGSGVMTGIQSARLLCNAVKDKKDPGDADALWKYTATFQRQLGAKLAAYNLVRRFTQYLTQDEVNKLIRSGFMTEELIFAGLKQDLPVPSVQTIQNFLTASFRDPLFAAKFARALTPLPLIYLHFRNFPEQYDANKYANWKAAAKILGV